MDGKAALMTNYTEYGLTHTDKDPALQGEYWFAFGPQFRMGVWGSNISYPSSDSHFLLRVNADIKIVFSADAHMIIKLTSENYFKSESRNGTVTGLHLDFFGYGIQYDNRTNFLGTEASATSYAFSKTWDVWSTWKWDNLVGYMMLNDSPAFSNYFWFESYLGTKPNFIYYQGGVAYNSGASQFNGIADVALILKATVSF